MKWISLFLLFSVVACSVKRGQSNLPWTLEALPSPAGSDSSEPFLLTSPDDTVSMTWVQKSDTASALLWSRFKENQWTEPITIASGNTWFVNWADYPALAINGNNLLAHFLDKSSGSDYSYDVKVTGSSDGKKWSTPWKLNDDGKNAEHGFVTLLPYGQDFLAVWLDGRNTVMEGMENMKGHDGHHGAMSLRAAVIDAAGKKRNEWELDNKTCDCCQTSAAITPQGPVVVYRDRSDEEVRDISIVRFVDQQWTKPVSVYADNWKINGCPVNGPRVVARGNALAVAWFSATNDSTSTSVIFSSDGGASFGERIQLSNAKTSGRVDIEWVDDEGVMVSWIEGNRLLATQVQTDGSKQEPQVIGSISNSRSSGFPQMTKSGNEFIFAWTDVEANGINVVKVTPLGSR